MTRTDPLRKKRFLIVFGTRPEALKCFPVVQAAQADPRLEIEVCITGQHRDMMKAVLDLTGMTPDHDLDTMRPDQGLSESTARILEGMGGVIRRSRPDAVFVQGDTTSAMAAALAAFHHHIPVFHIEAGLRSHDLMSPWPEEANRQLIGDLASLHFAPTAEAQANLIGENKPSDHVVVTGNPGIDTLLHFSRRLDQDRALADALAARFDFLDPAKTLVLATCHRRENFGDGIAHVCAALETLAGRGDVEIVLPVHPNPSVHAAVHQALSGVEGIHLVEPLDYLTFIHLLKRAALVLTDSGGIQEEAPSLGKPVLVLRDTTERPEGVAAGNAKLVGSDAGRIVRETSRLLDDAEAYAVMSHARNPYGDGHAGVRIVAEALRHG